MVENETFAIAGAVGLGAWALSRNPDFDFELPAIELPEFGGTRVIQAQPSTSDSGGGSGSGSDDGLHMFSGGSDETGFTGGTSTTQEEFEDAQIASAETTLEAADSGLIDPVSTDSGETLDDVSGYIGNTGL